MNSTFIMCKPDAVERGLVGEIITRIEAKGLRIVAMDLRTPDRQLAEEHYAEHGDKPFFGELVDFLTRNPVVAMVLGVGVAGRQADLVARLTTLDADVRDRLAAIPPEARTLASCHSAGSRTSSSTGSPP